MFKGTLYTLILIVLIIQWPLLMKGQEMPHYKHQFGAAAGFSTGYGLSYRYWPDQWGIQGTFSPYYDGSGPTVSIGLTGIRLIEDNGWSRFFIYLGNHLQIDTKENYNYPDPDPELETVTTYVLGAGPGIEFLIKRRLGFNLMFGLALFTDNSDLIMTHLTGETGIFFRF